MSGLGSSAQIGKCSKENWPRLVQHGILDSLAAAGLSPETCLCSLSLSRPHHVETTDKCILAMIHLSSCADGEVARQSVGSLANLAEDVDTHEYIARAGGGRCLISLENHDSLDIHREATRGIANILTSFRHQTSIIQDGIPGLIHLATSQDEECAYHAALCFRKLSPNLKAHPIFVYNNGFKALFHLLQNSNLNTQKQAAAALRDVAANPEYKLKCADDGGIDALITLARQPEVQLQALAIASLRHLSTEEKLKDVIVGARALRPIVRCVTSSSNEDIHLQAAGILANLSELPENQLTCARRKTLTLLCINRVRLCLWFVWQNLPLISPNGMLLWVSVFWRLIRRCEY